MMSNDKIFKTLNQYKKFLEDKGYDVVYIGLFGSQNYNLDDENSDIDARAVILPSLDNLIEKTTIAEDIELETGKISISDVMHFVHTLSKGNPAMTEVANTEYYIGNKDFREIIKQVKTNPRAMLGIMNEKRKALTHPFPSKEKEISMWGFDPKQWHHMIRMKDLLEYCYENDTNIPFLTYEGEKREKMLSCKRNKLNTPVDRVIMLCDAILKDTEKFVPEGKYTPVDIFPEVYVWLKKELKKKFFSMPSIQSAYEVRTFDGNIPKRDLRNFPELAKYQGQDISYIVYQSIEIHEGGIE